MKSRRCLFSIPLAIVTAIAWGAAAAASPGNESPANPAPAATPQATAGASGNTGGRWGEIFSGPGRLGQTRCQGMSRGANCITPASRKEAAARAAAARAVANSNAPAATTGAPAPMSGVSGGTQ